MPFRLCMVSVVVLTGLEPRPALRVQPVKCKTHTTRSVSLLHDLVLFFSRSFHPPRVHSFLPRFYSLLCMMGLMAGFMYLCIILYVSVTTRSVAFKYSTSFTLVYIAGNQKPASAATGVSP